jgi:hypothetical protein
MAQPQLSWWNLNNDTQRTSWNIGTVDAGSASSQDVFLIWNNRGGSTDLSDCLECTITTKDIAGGNTGELVTEKWIQVRVDTMGEVNFTAIGGDVTKAVKAGGNAPAGVIKGTANDGTKANSVENFAQVTLYAQPSATATAGNVDFLLRLSYTYV